MVRRTAVDMSARADPISEIKCLRIGGFDQRDDPFEHAVGDFVRRLPGRPPTISRNPSPLPKECEPCMPSHREIANIVGV